VLLDWRVFARDAFDAVIPLVHRGYVLIQCVLKVHSNADLADPFDPVEIETVICDLSVAHVVAVLVEVETDIQT
jgi:hypothetical protein